eukprot:2441143-Rhodomonas_salina.2
MNTNKRSDCSHCPFLSPSLPLTSDFKGLYGDYLPWASKIYSSSVKMGCAASLMGNRPWTAEDFEKYDQIKQMWAKMDADGSGYIEIRYNVLTSARKAIPNRSLDAGNSNFRWTSLVVEKLEWTPSNSLTLVVNISVRKGGFGQERQDHVITYSTSVRECRFCKYNGLTITDEVKKNLDARGRAKFEEGEVEHQRITDGHGHLLKDANGQPIKDRQAETEKVALLYREQLLP